jgi:hypothetical protein
MRDRVVRSDTLKLELSRGQHLRAASTLVPVALFSLAGCGSKPDMVTVTPIPGSNVSFTESYQIDEGQKLDLVVGADTGAKITSSTLPTNATLMNGVFSFAPDYTQAGLYTVTFTITSGTTITTKVLAVRVLDVVHIASPPPVMVNEGSAATTVTFMPNTPKDTIVSYSADLSQAPGAALDPVAGTLSFTPSWRWVDTHPPGLAIVVTASAQQPETGKWQTSTAVVEYQIVEATSFSQELVPIFLFPPGGTTQQGMMPPATSIAPEGHNCIYCHDGSGPNIPAAIDFRPPATYASLVNAALAPAGIGGSCSGYTANGAQRVTPGDLTKSIFFWKISNTDGAGNAPIPCGTQMPENLNWYYLTVTDENAWEACGTGNTICEQALDCAKTDVTCSLDARLVRKTKLWIMAGALQN